LSNLNSFDFCQTLDPKIFTRISEWIADTITTISIFIVPEGSGDESLGIVMKFVDSLGSLKSVSIVGHVNIDVTPIILSLRKHSSSLITLKLALCTIDDDAMKSLSEHDQLREIVFHQLHFSSNHEIPLPLISLPRLKSLNYWEYNSTNSPVHRIIRDNGENLTHLNIHTNIERCIKLFDTISTNCPFLISFTTPISEQRDFIALFSILERCNHLKRLCIHEFNIININEGYIVLYRIHTRFFIVSENQ